MITDSPAPVRASTAPRLHRPLMVAASVMSALVMASLFGMVVDDRMLLGESIWFKPFKFGLSFALYTATLAWLLSFPHRGSRITWWMGTAFAVTGIVDVGFIVTQASRGTFSHFNTETDAVNTIGQNVFMSGVIGLFVANVVIAVVLSWQRITDRPTGLAIRAGLFIAALGMAMAYLVGWTGRQQSTDAYGKPVELAAGHTVMPDQPLVRDGVGAMPVTHWSTVGGDLRIPHFLGMHGIQLLIIAALALAWFAPRVPWLRGERARAQVIAVLSLAYTALMAVLLWQALRGQPITRPDAATLTAFGVLVAATAAGVALVRYRAGRVEEVSAGAPRPEPVRPASR
ncbi:hypothetical protein [Nocardia sp. NPDC050406]|uniref:hypothetical protein n=1 Tax=Nocardia sp. NPDC050406 TaxID=3364318 RepID=UPI003798D555